MSAWLWYIVAFVLGWVVSRYMAGRKTAAG